MGKSKIKNVRTHKGIKTTKHQREKKRITKNGNPRIVKNLERLNREPDNIDAQDILEELGEE